MAGKTLAACVFSYCPDSGSQPLESLQSCQQWQRTPLPAGLPALVEAKWLPPLSFYLTEYTKPFKIRVNLLYEKQVLLREELREDENRRVYKSRIETSRQGNPFRESAAGGS